MGKRKIIKINHDKCNGCGECIPNCPEGALQLIDGKARLVSDIFCDGLGACIGNCPVGAITIEERDAAPYDEKDVMKTIIKQGPNVIKAHLMHLKEHGEEVYLKDALGVLKAAGLKNPLEGETKPSGGCSAGGACPGSRVMDFAKKGSQTPPGKIAAKHTTPSRLKQWPVQLMLAPPMAPYLNDADILIAADCVPFAYGSFHEDLLKGKALLVGCPKLDDMNLYKGKLAAIFKMNNVSSVTYAHMEVPCCYGLIETIKAAISASGKGVKFEDVTISVKGEKI